jgi:protein-disulfide isomerase
MLIALVFGFWMGSYTERRSGGGSGGGSETAAAAPGGKVAPGAAPAGDVERYKLPIGPSAMVGPETALVTIVEFSDFQCPFCGRVVETVKQIEKAYPKQVRLQFRHNPLPFHDKAQLAAEAAVAAGAQGKFWEMHDKLFANQQALDRPNLEKYAGELGLDMNKFKAALDSGSGKAMIDSDKRLAAQFGATGTPSFFINGRPVRGAVPFDNFKKVIDEEIVNATALTRSGVPIGQLYAKVVEKGRTSPAPQAPPPNPEGNVVYKVPVGAAPSKGTAEAKVTIIEYSDFQCPFCSRVEPTLKQLEQDYASKGLRIVWKDNPLPFHQNAMPAAMASRAAAEQGKFWEMHDMMFQNQQKLERADLDSYAEKVGLNMGKYKAAMDAKKFDKAIEADMAEAATFGARGTPSFFINGRPLRGAQPVEQFKTVIDEELKKADAAVARGIKPAALYAELTKDGKVKAEAPPAPQRAGEPDPNVTYRADVGKAPTRGAKNAKVTIVLFSDFQCPFCGRVEPTLEQVLKEYPKDVRIAWKNLPLPFHQNAMPAAEAAMAANEQGKFWEMHDLMFKNQQKLAKEDLEGYAKQLGLDMAKWNASIESHKYKKDIEADTQAGNKIGARGTPTMFVNGKVLVGAQPIDEFKKRIDAEIKHFDEMVKKGTAPGKVYDKLMAEAKAEVPAPAPGAPGGGGPPPVEKTVFKVDAGNAPAKGGKNAPITIVMFSDFQCPFCSRVEPTIKQVQDTYKDKVRVVWKNYPLPFHDKAMGAAEAAMAAGEQGKFWEMHDLMFKNQQALDRPSLEKYAEELKLDMGKFKAALDSGKFKTQIQGDITYGNSISGPIGTPTSFINGRKIAGAYPFESFKQVIDEELAKRGGGKNK